MSLTERLDQRPQTVSPINEPIPERYRDESLYQLAHGNVQTVDDLRHGLHQLLEGVTRLKRSPHNEECREETLPLLLDTVMAALTIS